jgi:hypothetical protein
MNRMKAVVFALALTLGGAGLAAQTVLSRLGVSESHAREIVMSAIEGIFGLGNTAKPFLALAPAARAAAVNEVVGWAKAYFASPTFKAEWAKERDQAKPQQDARGTVDDELKAKLAEQQKGLDDAKKMLPMLPPDGQKAMLEQLKQMEATMKDPAQQKMQRDMIVAERGDKDKQFQDDMKRWGEQFPADYNLLLAKRLHDFLALSADVNFDAKLKVENSVKVFADPQFEEKATEWKMCYRAGREATQAARAAATQWLKEIGR